MLGPTHAGELTGGRLRDEANSRPSGKETAAEIVLEARVKQDEGLKAMRQARMLSPNLGCPLIVSPESIEKDAQPIVLAIPREEKDIASYTLRVLPSFRGEGEEFALCLVNPDVLDEDVLPDSFEDVSDTRRLISTYLRSSLFGRQTRFWSFRGRPQGVVDQRHYRQVNGESRLTLYDLILYRQGTAVSAVKHALCLRPPFPQVRFVHLTDLHVAERNDMWAKEINSTVGPVPVEDSQGFINFNQRLRHFIDWANKKAVRGELDLVLTLGDLVDFVAKGVGKAETRDTNWHNVIQIFTGSIEESGRQNSGLRVPIFTSTGNHDWRLYPYPPDFDAAIFGLDRGTIQQLDYLYGDSSDAVGKKIGEVNSKLITEGSPILVRSWWGGIIGPGLRWLELIGEHFTARTVAISGRILNASNLPASFGVLLAALLGLDIYLPGKALGGTTLRTGVLLLAVLVLTLSRNLVRNLIGEKLRKVIEGLIAIESGVRGLSDYFLQINPYFNYAFRVANCYFAVLDTGHDCLTGQSFWDSGGKKVDRVTVRDNIIGGSPDSMAFYPPNPYYHYSQIAWLEQVLDCVKAQQHQQLAGEPRRCRVFIGLHAPPGNLSLSDRHKADRQLAALGNQPFCLHHQRFGGFNIGYGCINHYLSDFYYLCLGCRETSPDKVTGPGVDAVFAGHAHWTLEFALRRPKDAKPGGPWKPELYYGRFSEAVEKNEGVPNRWWGPLLLQTGACGPPSSTDPHTPNFRYVSVEQDLRVTALAPRHL